MLKEIYAELGITEKHLEKNKLLVSEQPPLNDLEVVDIDFEGRPFILTSTAAKAWRSMVAAAKADGINLRPFSGFRSYIHQRNLIERHRKEGRELETILTYIAIPGFSEHHTGRAVDIHGEGTPILEEAFENTNEFRWLSQNAHRFNFSLSYPRNNKWGIVYEPWHWLYKG